jgi:hypothetical protein
MSLGMRRLPLFVYQVFEWFTNEELCEKRSEGKGMKLVSTLDGIGGEGTSEP